MDLRKRKVLELLRHALERDQAERNAYLEKGCGEDRDLRREVERLLKLEDVCSGFLEVPEQPVRSRHSTTCGVSFLPLDDRLGGDESSLSTDSNSRFPAERRSFGSSAKRLRTEADFTDPRPQPESGAGSAGFDPDAPLPFEDFELTRELGRGGVGTVYDAVQKSLNKHVALKILRGFGTFYSEAVKRFVQEARAVAQLSHPNIVAVHGIGRTPEGGYFLVMDLVEGVDLQKRIDAAEVPVKEATRIVATLADAVQHAHEKGIIHRDLKPSNVLLEAGSRPILTDFGLAKHFKGDVSGISGSSQIVGTPAYMAPEQIDRDRGQTGPRTDVYGLGGILYALLVRRPPFVGQSMTQVFAQILAEDPPVSPRSLRPEIPETVDDICTRCLKKNPLARFATPADLAEALTRWPEKTDRGTGATELSLRLEINPKAIRPGDTFLLKVGLQGLPECLPLTLKVRASSNDVVVPIGPGLEWEGLASESYPAFFSLLAVGEGPARLEVEALVGEKNFTGVLEFVIQPRTSLPFVGRFETKRSIARWSDVTGCGLFLLRGEPGIGKTRLAWEMVVEFAKKGGIVVTGRGRRSFRFPLQPFREICLRLLQRSESETGRPGFLDLLHASLRHLLPREFYIADYFRAFLASESIAPEQKSMLPYYWLQLFQSVAKERRMVAVLDDMQWADAESIQLLADLLGLAHQRGVDIKVLAIVQPFALGQEESKTLSFLKSKIAALEGDRIRVNLLDLRPLDESELNSLIDSCFPDNSFRRDLPWLFKALRQKTGGNPLFGEWVLKQLRADSESPEPLLRGEGPNWMPSPSLTPEWFEAFVPQQIESILGQRLSVLPLKAREACQIAAAVGDLFDLRLLEELLGGANALDETLPLLEAEELVVATQDPFFYRFAHSLIPQKVYRDFIEQSRWKAARLHARIADAMTSIYSSKELAEHALGYAQHLVLGNRREKGFKYLLLGSRRMLEQQLYASAVSHLERAWSLADSGVQVDPKDRALLLVRLGETYRFLGRTQDALKVLELARELKKEMTAELRASVEITRGSIHVQCGELDKAEELFRSVLSMQMPENELQIAAAVSGLASVQRIRGHYEEALKGNLEALELREKARLETEAAVSCVNLGNTYCDLGEYEEAEQAYQRSLPIFEKKGLKNYLVYALAGLGNVLFRRDRPRAAEFYETAMRLCQETGNRTQLGVLHYNLGETALAGHRYCEALLELELSLEMMDAVGRRAGEVGARCRKASVHQILADHETASHELEKAREVASATGSQLDMLAVHVQACRLAYDCGNLSRAREELDEALRLLSERDESHLRLVCARMLIDLGELARARKVLEKASNAPMIRSDPEARCLLEHLLGVACENARGGLEHLEKALELAGEDYSDLPRLLAELAARVEGERSKELLARAVAVLKARGETIKEVARRQRFLFENRSNREVLSRARRAGVSQQLGHRPDADMTGEN